ncbi:MAG TPA: M13 family peptidase [Prolixibacteraceae bacterium]|jgi:putative endopeptidase|nr:M13 family peptidase [Prolixibacteraceae bacterium]
MKRYLIPFSFLTLLLVGISCQPSGKDTTKDPLAAHIDPSIKPGDDFFMYANGQWFKENPIAASEQSSGIWQLIQDTINAQILKICKSSAMVEHPEKGSNKQKIGDFYYSGMDSVHLNSVGISAIQKYLDQIDAITDFSQLATMASFIQRSSGSPLFAFGVGQDSKISSKNAVQIWQGGLSLPDRSYYFDKDARTVMIREKFEQHLENMFRILKYDEPKAKLAASNMIKLETALALASRKKEDTRDPHKNYNKLSFKQLSELTPNFNWPLFDKEAGLQNVDTVIVGQPEFLSALNTNLKKFPLQDWKDYLKYHFTRGMASYLDDATYKETFSFYSQTIRGVQQPKPRWKRVVEQNDGYLGELIGQVYVNEYLPKGTKEKLVEIGNAVKNIYAERIKNLDWMSAPTKEKALKKLGSMIMKVGYPDKWKDLSSLEVNRSSFAENAVNANLWHFGYMISKFGKPVDRTEWDMEPQNYNAYYNPSNNELVVPGCNIIVPGYERKMADDAILYSIIGGSTFGHEMTHGFDDQGCKFDANGNLNNWWTKEDSIKFYSKTKMIVRQFNQYNPIDSLHINGELTQGENIADLGGIIMGYEAFKKTRQYHINEMIANETPDQRFFLGFALAWMVNMRPEAIANQVHSDEHSPAKYRVIGTLSNMPEFYKAFGVKEGDKMWRPDSLIVRIW